MNKRLLLAASGWVVLVGLSLFLGLRWGGELWALLRDEARLDEALAALGPVGPLAFIGLQVLQIVIFIIPGEVVQIAGGYIYGPWVGLLYSLVGIALGSTAAFFLGRALGRPFVEALARPETVARLDGAIRRSRSLVALFILFLLPGIPKDILCYISGLSAVPFLVFSLVSMLGRLPGLILSLVFGSKLAAREWPVVIAISVATLLLLVLTYLFRGHLQRWHDWLSERLGRGDGGST
ncbi:MAG: TVP38/TMEM64 family protein [Candidatus Acetothermia bacterium]|jgi:uncharacterized membrane protein YdjX (TVP38/TMEM64 family)|nr:TVP38/TMEM64 family protein [Candidatus Acetothermia bacterium]MDH7505809.1 TVP38/TMEM64 family protein [Candidatus Acetothermia bacterium]